MNTETKEKAKFTPGNKDKVVGATCLSCGSHTIEIITEQSRLSAAAPELLEAAKKVFKWIEKHGASITSDHWVDPWISLVDAIKKAEGR